MPTNPIMSSSSECNSSLATTEVSCDSKLKTVFGEASAIVGAVDDMKLGRVEQDIDLVKIEDGRVDDGDWDPGL